MKVYVVTLDSTVNTIYTNEMSSWSEILEVAETLEKAEEAVDADRLRILNEIVCDDFDLDCDWVITQEEMNFEGTRFGKPQACVHAIGKNHVTGEIKRDLYYQWRIVEKEVLSDSQSEHDIT